MSAAFVAGLASTLLFAGSMLPMVVRARRTRDLESYSRSQLVMTNIGNAVHTLYVVSLPVGPLWLLHGFHAVVAATMLVWHLRFAGRRVVRDAPTPHRDGEARRGGARSSLACAT